jgi:hypothetical protein
MTRSFFASPCRECTARLVAQITREDSRAAPAATSAVYCWHHQVAAVVHTELGEVRDWAVIPAGSALEAKGKIDGAVRTAVQASLQEAAGTPTSSSTH